MKVDIIQRHYSDDTKEYSIAWGLRKDLTFVVYSIPDFVMIFDGHDQAHAQRIFNQSTAEFIGERESTV